MAISFPHCFAAAEPDRSAVPSLNPFGRTPFAVVGQAPGGHLLRRAFLLAHDDVAVPRPGMIAVILAGARRMVRVRMIPADNIESVLARGFFGAPHVVHSD